MLYYIFILSLFFSCNLSTKYSDLHLHLHGTSSQSHLTITRWVVANKSKRRNNRIGRESMIVKSEKIDKSVPSCVFNDLIKLNYIILYNII